MSYFFRWEERFYKYCLLPGSEVGVTGGSRRDRLHLQIASAASDWCREVAVDPRPLLAPSPRIHGTLSSYQHTFTYERMRNSGLCKNALSDTFGIQVKLCAVFFLWCVNLPDWLFMISFNEMNYKWIGR